MAISKHWYFAWVDPPGTDGPVFDESYARDDEIVLAFKIDQQEGEFATLELTIKGRGIALLSASRKQWGWLSEQNSTEIVSHFFGRLTGVQAVRSEDGPVAILTFTAAPSDFAAQKKELANSLRVLPYYEPIFIDPQDREDDDLVLEGYPKRWHIDRLTHEVTASDELTGEDGIETFGTSETLYDGFSIELANVPAPSVTVNANLNWTQTGTGDVDLTDELVTNWPGGSIKSYTFGADSWPKSGASLGSGWVVKTSTCREVYDLTVKSTSFNSVTTVDFGDWGIGTWGGELGLPSGASSVTINLSGSDQALTATPPGSITFPDITSESTVNVIRESTALHWRDNSEENEVDTLLSEGIDPITSYSQSVNYSGMIIPLHYLRPTLVSTYTANRSCTEVVTLTLTADLQPVVAGPDDGKALDSIDLNSVNLSESTDDNTTDGDIPIVDPRRRSYICTERGQNTIKHMLARASAALISSSRCVNISFVPKDFDRMAWITLRKNVTITRPEIPGGEATGKIISYTYGMEMDSRALNCSITIACCIGHGGAISVVNGTPLYVEAGYVEEGYQEEEGGTALFDETVGYTPPLFNPQDDGLDFIAGVNPEDAFEQSLSVTNSSSEQESAINSELHGWFNVSGVIIGNPDNQGNTQGQLSIDNRRQAVNDFLDTIRTVATFKLKPMNGSFSSPYTIDVTALKLPTMIDLEAA